MAEMSVAKSVMRVPEALYAYYRRCQVFRRNGAQCKAPAEKGSRICHAHAGQLAMAVRRERECRAVLAEAVAEMRRRGRPDCEMADLLTDFKGIQVTTAVMARALIKGAIDCKTAGQMVVHLQTFSKLLWQIHRKTKSTTEARRHGEKQGSPQICADERRLGKPKTRKDLPLIHTDLKKLPKAKSLPRIHADGADWTELLWKIHRKERKEKHISPQICTDERRLSKPKERGYHRAHREAQRTRALTTKDTKKHEGLPQICADERRLSKPKETMPLLMAVPKNLYRERAANCDGAKVLPFEASAFRDRSWAHGPPKSKAA
jgi:hypothetical protein